MPIEVQATHYGLRSTVWDPITPEEEQSWLASVKAMVPQLDPFYGQLVDLRRLRVDALTDPNLVKSAMEFVLAHGLQRSAVIVDDPVIAMHTKRLSWETGVYRWERYLDASEEPDWERVALDWIDHAIDPDL